MVGTLNLKFGSATQQQPQMDSRNFKASGSLSGREAGLLTVLIGYEDGLDKLERRHRASLSDLDRRGLVEEVQGVWTVTHPGLRAYERWLFDVSPRWRSDLEFALKVEAQRQFTERQGKPPRRRQSRPKQATTAAAPKRGGVDPEERAKIIELFHQGLPLSQIGDAVGRSGGAIAKLISTWRRQGEDLPYRAPPS